MHQCIKMKGVNIGCLFVSLLLGSRCWQQGAGQMLNMLPPTYFEESGACNKTNLTASITPDNNRYSFLWVQNPGQLRIATIRLNGSGGIGVTYSNGISREIYVISHNPPTLSTPTERFRSTLIFNDLPANESVTINFSVVQGTLVSSENVSAPGCVLEDDPDCTNCVSESLPCGHSFGKECKCGDPIEAVCSFHNQVLDNCVPFSCNTSFLDDLNAETDPPTLVVDCLEELTVICKRGYVGNDTEYQCISDEEFASRDGINISCDPVQCDQEFLTGLNAEVMNSSTSVIVFPNNVRVQCKPGYVGNDVVYQCNATGHLVPVDGVAIKCSGSYVVLIVCCVVGGILIGVGIGLIIYYYITEKDSVLYAALLVMGVGFLLIGVGLVVGLPDEIAAVVCGSIIIAGGIIEGFVSILLFGGCIKSGKEKFAKGERSRSTSNPEETKELATTSH